MRKTKRGILSLQEIRVRKIRMTNVQPGQNCLLAPRSTTSGDSLRQQGHHITQLAAGKGIPLGLPFPLQISRNKGFKITKRHALVQDTTPTSLTGSLVCGRIANQAQVAWNPDKNNILSIPNQSSMQIQDLNEKRVFNSMLLKGLKGR